MATLYDRAAVIPGRTSTRSKSPDRLQPLWAVESSGSDIWASDDAQYLDMMCGLGAISVGYSGVTFPEGVCSLPHRFEVDAAESVLQSVAPWASHVRFFKTGSEATHAAYRIAKAATRRPYAVALEGAYHGWHEWVDVLRRVPNGFEFGSGGYITVNQQNAVTMTATEAIAAVIIEPPRFGGWCDVSWLRSVRAFCDRIGALLVFDSMIYGGRWHLGGASGYFGVQPDLECFGKAYGNGQAVAFVVGREALERYGEIASGTFSGDVTGLSALEDTIYAYKTAPIIETIWARGRQLREGFDARIPRDWLHLEGDPPLQRLVFGNEVHRKPFADAMLARGILIYPDWLMTMYAHTEAHMAQVVEAAEQACQTLNS